MYNCIEVDAYEEGEEPFSQTNVFMDRLSSVYWSRQKMQKMLIQAIFFLLMS